MTVQKRKFGHERLFVWLDMWIFNIKLENTIAAYELCKRFRWKMKKKGIYIYIYINCQHAQGLAVHPIGDLPIILAVPQSGYHWESTVSPSNSIFSILYPSINKLSGPLLLHPYISSLDSFWLPETALLIWPLCCLSTVRDTFSTFNTE